MASDDAKQPVGVPVDGGKVVQSDGLVCVVGRVPASGMTIGEIRDRLSQYDDAKLVGFCTSIYDNFEVLSLYEASETGHVWFDLGEPGS